MKKHLWILAGCLIPQYAWASGDPAVLIWPAGLLLYHVLCVGLMARCLLRQRRGAWVFVTFLFLLLAGWWLFLVSLGQATPFVFCGLVLVPLGFYGFLAARGYTRWIASKASLAAARQWLASTIALAGVGVGEDGVAQLRTSPERHDTGVNTSLNGLSQDTLRRVALILADRETSQDEAAERVAELVPDRTTAQRAKDWLPEAFGWHLIAEMPGAVPPRSFHVRTASGAWKELPMQTEPLFDAGLLLADQMVRDGLHEEFSTLAKCSSMLDALNRALNAGSEVSGTVISGPAFIALRYEMYERALQTT